MKKILLFSLTCLVLSFMALGCQAITDDDIEAVKNWILEEDSVWFDANTTVDTMVDDTQSVKLFMADSTGWIVWWRGPQTHGEPVFDIQGVGDSIWVDWTSTNIGKMGILAGIFRDSVADTIVYWEKDVSESTQLRGIFRKTGPDTDPFMGWTLEKISCAVGISDAGTVRIDSVHIVSSEYDEWITDPLNTYYDIVDLVTFHAQEDVTVTLYANSPETEAFIHSFILLWPFYVRAPFEDKGEGVHEGVWKAQLLPFPRFAIFDLMGTSTLWTEEGVYDFHGILFPYNIVWP